MQFPWRQRVCFNGFSCVWERIWPRLLCACDFIKGVCFRGMAEKQKKLKRKAHNLPIIPIMCQNIEEWFMWQSPCMIICCFMASECRDKYNFIWKRHKIAKSWWPNAAEWRIWFIFQSFHPWEHYKINSTKISSETWTTFAVTKVRTGGGASPIVKPAVWMLVFLLLAAHTSSFYHCAANNSSNT